MQRGVTATSEALQLDSVRIGQDGATELDRGRPLLFIPHEDILSIELVYAAGVPRPFVVGTVGMLVLLAGLLLPIRLLLEGAYRVRFGFRMLAFVALLFPGAALVRLATRRRWLLLVQTVAGERRLLFQTIQDPVVLEQFLRDARMRFGY